MGRLTSANIQQPTATNSPASLRATSSHPWPISAILGRCGSFQEVAITNQSEIIPEVFLLSHLTVTEALSRSPPPS
jgi:hypothetical protein